MSKHDDDTCPHLVRASLLETENTRLKTEVEHLMIFCNCTLIPNKELQDENARLKAEVEELTFNPSHYIDDSGEWVAPAIFYRVRDRLIDQQNENARLKAEVERLRNLATKIDVCVDVLVLENGLLRKAGDAMADCIAYELRIDEGEELPICVQRWNAAKEGKPSV